VTLAFLDGSGKTIRTFTSEEKKSDSAAKPATPPAGRDSVRAPGRDSTARDTAALKGVKLRLEQGRDTASFVPGDSVVPARTGANRFVWNLRYPGVHALKDVLVDEGILEGPLVVPGNYTAKLTVDGKSYTQPFTVVMDPRVKTSAQDLQAQLALLMHIHDQIDTVTYTVERIGRMIDQIGDRQAQVKGQSYASRVEQPAKALKPKLDSVRNALAEVEMHAYEISLHYPVRIYNQLLTLNAMTQSADAAPTQAELDSYKDLAAQVDRQLRRLADLERTDVAAFNQTMKQLDVPAVMTSGQKADLVP
jgi:hypothetical protein